MLVEQPLALPGSAKKSMVENMLDYIQYLFMVCKFLFSIEKKYLVSLCYVKKCFKICNYFSINKNRGSASEEEMLQKKMK